MNLHPKVRPLWQRVPLCAGLAGLAAYKALRLPTSILPRDIKAIVRNWDFEMFGKIIGSGLTSAFIDQPCYFKAPAKIEPKAEVAPEYRMSPEQLSSFYERGFVGPFDVFTPAQMQDFKHDLLAIEGRPSATYGFTTPRDRHLEMPRLWNYMRSPAVTERIAQILGPDLNCWRSQIFYKGPGSPAIQWHQASTFMVEDYQDPAIFPEDRSEIFQITAWIAVDDSTTENGCLRFAARSHDRVRPILFGGNEGFYNAAFRLDFDESEAEVVEVPCRAGQMVLFTERCIHGSAPNTTDRHRLAFNMRVTPTNIAVYPNKKHYRSVYNGGKYVLDKWGVCSLRGEDRHGLSKTVSPEQLERDGAVAPLKRAA
ncbi:Phytanoyl-CoA dioxygenase (PhyH) [Pseudobythopirellula maris]|uniref:Phytanoyl-CoA dioxygenase (PhyH) n=1 Tax=Pseudobythopirellula maris TaxID=2527991 RepID=A0A5C5ZSF2_9BACT|nr:phytanoyl-CoA dioxygenase family protein [Pseudobythopirellula maris]TWT89998.1 Phytanoyl-CoA dioxygenase (PhyH) [Pseudobythopirellula maris]